MSGPSVWPPYFIKTENGARAGEAFDMAHDLFGKLSRNITIDPIKPWARVLNQLETGKIDIVLAMLYSKERAETFILSKPWTRSTYAIVTLKENGFSFTNIDALENKMGGYLNGTVLPETYREFAAQNKGVVKLTSIPSIYKTLIQKRLDYVIVARDAFFEILPHDVKASQFTTLPGSEACVPIYMAISRNSPCAKLAEQINSLLKVHKDTQLFQTDRPIALNFSIQSSIQ